MPNPNYKSPRPAFTDPSETFSDDNPRIADVESAFQRSSRYGDHLAVWDNDLFPQFRYTRVNREGINAGINHIQGIQRLKQGKYLAISAGDSTASVSHIFVAQLESRSAQGAWGSNVLQGNAPPQSDKILKTVPLDRTCWHAGGISVLGDILAVPLFGNGQSKVLFLNMRSPENPTIFKDSIIERQDIQAANAVALAKLPNGQFVCGVWREVQRKPKGRIDFYISHGSDFRKGFRPGMVTWSYGDLGLNESRDPQYQSINFIMPEYGSTELPASGSTTLYMVGTENEANAAPFQTGSDIADLFRVDIPNDLAAGDYTQKPVLTRLCSREFFCNKEYCNFDAAAGAYVEAGNKLSLYTGFHWRVDGTFRLSEFRAEPDPSVPVSSIASAWIELYEHENFRGRRLTILGRGESSFRDYSKISVQGSGFNDRVSSARWQIPGSNTYRLYKNKDFEGEHFDLAGTGQVGEIGDLSANPHNFGDVVSSSRYV